MPTLLKKTYLKNIVINNNNNGLLNESWKVINSIKRQLKWAALRRRRAAETECVCTWRIEEQCMRACVPHLKFKILCGARSNHRRWRTIQSLMNSSLTATPPPRQISLQWWSRTILQYHRSVFVLMVLTIQLIII